MTASGPRSLLQPALDDVGTPLADVVFCVVDLETTGGSESDAITEFGAVLVRGGEVLGEFQTLVNPHVTISPLIAALTGITNELVATAPKLSQALPAFLQFAQGSVLVAHNARFDVGFLKRACTQLDYPWGFGPAIDTVALARQALLRDEVPNVKLATLAEHFHTTVTPNHRALSDARATVDVLHGLLERTGNLGVNTLEDLREFMHYVSPARRAKRGWARDLPTGPGVYTFYADLAGQPRQVLYVGKSMSVRTRVRSYFTAAETRPRMDEMVRIATGVEAISCPTALAAEVMELRLIAAHMPRYNRRSKYPHKQVWIRLTQERFPRLSLVRKPGSEPSHTLGPFSSTRAAQEVMDVLHEAFRLRQCTARITARSSPQGCALKDVGKCPAPCLGEITPTEYGHIVDQVIDAFATSVRPVMDVMGMRLRRLISEERFETAAEVRDRLSSYLKSVIRQHRLQSLSRCPHIVAAYRAESDWEVHVIRFGRLAGSGRAPLSGDPLATIKDIVTAAQTVLPPAVPGQSAATTEETLRIADWLERPGVRLVDIDGDWSWPIGCGATKDQLTDLVVGIYPDTAQSLPGARQEACTAELHSSTASQHRQPVSVEDTSGDTAGPFPS